MVNLEIISVLVFVTIIGLFLIKDRKNIEVVLGIFIRRRWTKGLQIIEKLVKSHPKFFRIFGNVGVIVGILAGLLGFVVLVISAFKLQPTIALVLPTAGGYQIPGPVISIPFWYWLAIIFIIATTHETMHAFFARLENVPVKNYGLVMLILLPIAAFVDPDEKKLRRLPTLQKLRIFASGSFINILTSLLTLLILISSIFLFSFVTETKGVLIDSVEKDSPAEKSNLEGVIHKINDIEIKNTFDFRNALNETKPGQEIFIETDKGTFNLILSEHPEEKNKSYVGVKVRNFYEYKIFGLEGAMSFAAVSAFTGFIVFLNWLFLISLAVGVVNLLPIKPLDGGLFFQEIFTKLFKEKGRIIINITSFLVLGLILFSLFGVHIIRAIL